MRNSYLPNRNSEDQTKLDDTSLNPDKKLYQFKLILIGDLSVGKTAIFKRFLDDSFTNDHLCTVGVEQRIKTLKINDLDTADLKVWDTCGEEKFRSITRQYYRDSDGILLIFDLTDSNTLNRIDEWVSDVQQNGAPKVSLLLIGNKSDLVNERKVTNDMIVKLRKKHSILYDYIETSALTGENVQKAFKMIAEKIIQDMSILEEELGDFISNDSMALSTDSNAINSKKCC